MADLNNLLEELEEEQHDTGLQYYDEDDEDNAKDKPGRPSLAVTEATEPMMSEDWDDHREEEVPAVLQDAAAKRRDNNNHKHNHKNNMEEESPAAKDHRELSSSSEWFLGGMGGDEGTQHHETNELYGKLHQCWQQERHCPELLEYDEAMVEDIKAQMERRQEWIDQVMEGTSSSNSNSNRSSNGEASVQTLLATMAQVDLDRLRYVLSNWLNHRLAKIEAHPLHMRGKVDHLSDAELAYLKEYGSLLEDHLRRTVLDHLPEDWQKLDEPNMIDQPDYDGYHFWLVKEQIDADDVEQEEGTCLVAKYKDMRENMREGKVELQL